MKSSKIRLGIKSALYNFSTLWILLVILIFFSVTGRGFVSGGNISNIINQASFLCIIGVAQLIVILAGGVDLSIGSIMALSTVLCGPMFLAKSNTFFLIPVLLTLLFGGLVGLINGLMVTKLKIPAFLATFAVMYAARGAAWLYIGKGVYYGINKSIRYWATGCLFNIGSFRVTVPILVVLLFLVIMSFFLKKTILGREIYFTGANKTAACFAGIPAHNIIIWSHVLSGLISSFAGIMYVARINAADANLGVTYHFDAISVALIGGAVFSGGSGSVWGVAGGALIISIIQSGMNNLRVPTELQTAFLGLVIIVAVFLNQYLQTKQMSLEDKQIEKA